MKTVPSCQSIASRDSVPEGAWFATPVDVATIVEMPPECGSLSENALRAFQNQLCHVVAGAPGTWVVVDLSETHSLSAAFLGMLLTLSRQLRTDGRRLALAGLEPACREMIQTLCLDLVWPVFADVGEAKKRLFA